MTFENTLMVRAPAFHRTCSSCRSGTASLELTMCMPLLFAMMMLVLWQGRTMVGFSDATIEARHAAWQQRFERPPGTPLVFLRGEILEDAELVEDDVVTGRVGKRFTISPVVDWLPSPEAKFRLVAGSWDYRQLPLDDLPNWKIHGLMAISAKLGGFQNLVSQAGNVLNDLESAAEAVSDWQDRSLSDLENGVDDMQGHADEETRKRQQELEADLAATNARIADLQIQLDEVYRRLRELGFSDDEQPGNHQDDGDEDQDPNKVTELVILVAQRDRIKNDLAAAEREKQVLERELADLD